MNLQITSAPLTEAISPAANSGSFGPRMKRLLLAWARAQARPGVPPKPAYCHLPDRIWYRQGALVRCLHDMQRSAHE